ncbi:MAG: LysR family transcriptional regulator [Hydrogenophaga sp.]|nr:LysR family transcriptional regulator [Hydrogenophaga sp.]
MNLNLEEAALFLRVAELGSLSAAARESHLSVSQVSRTLVRLESGCGVRLMHRTTHGLSLTDEGDIFAAHARRLVDTRDELAAALHIKREGPSGWVRVAVSAVLAEAVIAPSLPSLYESFPQLQVDVMADDRLHDMARDGVDIAIRTGSPAGDNLVARQIAEHGRRLFASPAYVERFGMPQHPDELAQHRLITSSASPMLNRWPWSAEAKQPKDSVFVARGHTRSDNTGVTLSLVLRGVGIARLTDLVSKPYAERGDLVPVLDPWFDRSRVPIFAVMLPERHRLPKVRACIDHWATWMAGNGSLV